MAEAGSVAGAEVPSRVRPGRPVRPGAEPVPALAEFEKLVASHRIHYYMAGGAGGFPGRGTGGFAGRGAGGSRTDAAQISAWASAHFTASTVAGTTVYNLAGPMRR